MRAIVSHIERILSFEFLFAIYSIYGNPKCECGILVGVDVRSMNSGA